MIFLENDDLKATFTATGAELKSLRNKTTKLEYLWDSNPAYWGKSSPVLFPIVGALKNNTYTYQGHSYQLSRHGFARDQEFELIEQSSTEVLFTIRDTEATHNVYPFSFHLGIRYKLEGASLICSYEVHNPGSQILLFSLGAHPAFKVPLVDALRYEDYTLQFNEDTELQAYKIKDNLIDGQSYQIPLENGGLRLSHDLFKDDALVFKTLRSNQITIQSEKDKHGIRFNFEGFPYFGIWSVSDANFVCLEPWCGIADDLNHNGKLENKKGLVKVAAGTDWKRSWTVLCF